MTQPTDTVQNVLQLLKDLDINSSFEVYLPSLQKNIPFKQLNTEQLKKLLKTVIDSPIHNTEFITTINSILKENILDETINVDVLNVFDKILFIIKTRIESISPEYTFIVENEEQKDNFFKVNILEAYSNFVSTLPVYKEEIINFNNCELVVSLPTLQTENKIEKELYKNVKLEITTPKELRDSIGETFINELTKYIISLKINESAIDLSQLNFKNRINIVEHLPTNCINGVLKYIEKYRQLLKPLTVFTNNGIERELALDATFFNI